MTALLPLPLPPRATSGAPADGSNVRRHRDLVLNLASPVRFAGESKRSCGLDGNFRAPVAASGGAR